jgi:hypothetical protein
VAAAAASQGAARARDALQEAMEAVNAPPEAMGGADSL